MNLKRDAGGGNYQNTQYIPLKKRTYWNTIHECVVHMYQHLFFNNLDNWYPLNKFNLKLVLLSMPANGVDEGHKVLRGKGQL